MDSTNALVARSLDERVSLFALSRSDGAVIRGMSELPNGRSGRTVVWCPVPDGSWHGADVAAAYLLANCCTVVRFSATNAVGVSDGDRSRSTMSSLADDIEAVVDEVLHLTDGAVSVVAPSLAGRAAIRIASTGAWSRVDLVLYCPVVNVDGTFQVVYGRHYGEMFRWAAQKHRRGERLMDLLRVNVALIENARRDGWLEMSGTIDEVARLRCASLGVILGTSDEWVDVTEARQLFERRRDAEVLELPGIGHGIPAVGATRPTVALVRQIMRQAHQEMAVPEATELLEQRTRVARATRAIKDGILST